jgi:phosphodiesterase/alkaline phosphatase D-like protein
MALSLSALLFGRTFNPKEDFWYSFLSEAESSPGHSAAGSFGSIEKSNDLIGNRTLDLPACSDYVTAFHDIYEFRKKAIVVSQITDSQSYSAIFSLLSLS